MSGSGNRPTNSGGNRQRNLSVASNTSSSSFKDNSANNHRSLEPPQASPRRSSDLNSQASSAVNTNGRLRRDVSATVYRTNLPPNGRDCPRMQSDYEGPSSLNGQIDNVYESDREIQEKLNELQQKKWQYENVMSQLQQLQTSLSTTQSGIHPSHVPSSHRSRSSDFVNIEAPYLPSNSRTTKLQEAQQRLTGSLYQLQDLMQNVPQEVECNPRSTRHKDKNLNPRSSLIKECPDFLRNMATLDGTGMNLSVPRPRMNSTRQYNTVDGLRPMARAQHHHASQQNNLSMDSLMLKRTRPRPQGNASLIDMYIRSDEPSLNSSNDGSVEEMNNFLDEEEDEDNVHDRNSQDGQPLPQETSSVRHNIHARLENLEQQMERNYSLCELIIVEQRRMTILIDNLMVAVNNLQCNPSPRSNRSSGHAFHHLSLPLSSLPLNSTWQSEAGGVGPSDAQQLTQAVNQCCLLLSQLQRDLTSVPQPPEVNPQPVSHETARTPEGQHNPFRDMKGRTSQTLPSYECSNLDRFDPSRMTLNNRVPPTPRTNNYWDNFRSYSRQNLLSTGPSSKTSTESHMVSQIPHILPSVPTDSEATTVGNSRTTRRAKRKVNKGQRQVAIVVNSPHADNRTLAGTYGLTTGPIVPDNSAFIGRNLNPESDHANVEASISTVSDQADTVKKITKDTSNLKYSGARPKENRRRVDSTGTDREDTSNVNLMAAAESASQDNTIPITGSSPQPALESIIKTTLSEHATRPQFLSNLLQLLHKFDNDSLRQMALNALQGVADSHTHFELVRVFESLVCNQREFTPALLDNFITAIQQQQNMDEDHDTSVEGAVALPQAQTDDQLFYIRHALSPFLYRRLSQVQELISDTLIKLETGALTSQIEPPGAGTSSTTTVQEDDLAEADQSCEGVVTDSILADTSPAAASGPEWNEVEAVSSTNNNNSNRHAMTGGLDEVPTRLLSILSPPAWVQYSPSRSSPTVEDSGQHRCTSSSSTGRQRSEPECSSSAWFPEDDSV